MQNLLTLYYGSTTLISSCKVIRATLQCHSLGATCAQARGGFRKACKGQVMVSLPKCLSLSTLATLSAQGDWRVVRARCSSSWCTPDVACRVLLFHADSWSTELAEQCARDGGFVTEQSHWQRSLSRRALERGQPYRVYESG